MNYSLHAWSWGLFLALAGAAVADEVKLKNGHTLEGTVQTTEKKVTVDVGSGVITLDWSEVQSIHRSEQAQEYEYRLQAVKTGDANGFYQLYLWTREQPGMQARAETLLRKVLDADPNFEPAHRALGQVNYKGAWLTQDEYKAALGLVRYNGEWVSAEVAERLKRSDQDFALASGKQARQDERARQVMTLEQERIAQRQQFINMLSTGDIPPNVSTALGYPWAMRYWGAAQPLPPVPLTPQPNAD